MLSLVAGALSSTFASLRCKAYNYFCIIYRGSLSQTFDTELKTLTLDNVAHDRKPGVSYQPLNQSLDRTMSTITIVKCKTKLKFEPICTMASSRRIFTGLLKLQLKEFVREVFLLWKPCLGWSNKLQFEAVFHFFGHKEDLFSGRQVFQKLPECWATI